MAVSGLLIAGVVDSGFLLPDQAAGIRSVGGIADETKLRRTVGISDSTAGFQGPGAVGTTVTLPRDAFSYYGGRIDVQF